MIKTVIRAYREKYQDSQQMFDESDGIESLRYIQKMDDEITQLERLLLQDRQPNKMYHSYQESE